jgi:hypothetical protein
MAQILIDIPDELAQQLAPFQGQFSELFTRLIAVPLLRPSTPVSIAANSTYQEILDFLVSRPTSEQIVDFKVSEDSQNRLQLLLQKNKEAALTAAETAELDLYEQLNDLIGLLKVRAYGTVRQPTTEQ